MSKAKREVWMPARYEVADIRAIQALAMYAMGAERPWEPGQEPPVPSAADVKRALDWIINSAAQISDNGFSPTDTNGRIAAYIDGRQSVGQQIVKLMRLKPALFEESSKESE